MAKAMTRSLASSRRRWVSAILRFSVCADSVYMALARSSATMVNTTASSVSVKPRASRLGAERDEPVIESAVALVLLELEVGVAVLGAVEQVRQRAVGDAARVGQAAPAQRQQGAL